MNNRTLKLTLAFAGTLLVGAGLGYGMVASGALPGPQDQPQITGDGAQATSPSSQNSGQPVYTCPMHPQVVSDKPGQCPICGMDLVLKQAAAESAPVAGSDLAPGVQAVTLSPRQRVLANVETLAVTSQQLTRTIETTGKVAYDESKLSKISAWMDGRIDRLYVNTTGATVHRGQVIATLYSPEMLATQQEFLAALASAKELSRSPYPELAKGASELVAASRQRMQLMGATAAQIARLEATGKPVTSFPIVAPSSGVVVTRNVQQGQYVETGEPLFELADHSRVWVTASAYEADLGALTAGASAEVRTTAYPHRVFKGRVAFVQPTLSAETRTGEVRIELPNPQGLLKPEMFANVRISSPVGGKPQLAVPASAVIATGRSHVVYVETAPNRFEPRTLMVGAKAGESYPVFSGLREGEKVAVSGGFLLDASAQLSGGGAP